MPLIRKSLPDHAVLEFERNAPHFFKGVAVTRLVDVLNGDWQEMFNATLADCADGEVLANARQTGWRTVRRDDGDVPSSIEIGIDASGGAAFDGVSSGAPVQSAADLNLEEIATDGDYEARYLRVPSLYLSAVWLSGSGYGGSDKVVVLSPAPAGMEATAIMDAGGFSETVQSIASNSIGGGGLAPEN